MFIMGYVGLCWDMKCTIFRDMSGYDEGMKKYIRDMKKQYNLFYIILGYVLCIFIFHKGYDGVCWDMMYKI